MECYELEAWTPRYPCLVKVVGMSIIGCFACTILLCTDDQSK